MIRVLDSAGSTLVEWGRQQQQQGLIMSLGMDKYCERIRTMNGRFTLQPIAYMNVIIIIILI